MNQKQRKILAVLLAGFLWLPVLRAQTINIYYAAPADTIQARFGTAGVNTDCPDGYTRVTITSANAATFLAAAPPTLRYVYNRLQPGTELRRQVDQVFRNSAGVVTQVDYWLVNDTRALPGGRGIMSVYTDNGQTYVWPAANNRRTSASPLAYRGWVMLGEHQLLTDQSRRTGLMLAVDEVVLHESSHTQWVGEWTKWGAINGNAITYGADGVHYFSIAELLGDQEGAINEGLATFYGYVMNDAALQVLMNDFNSTAARYFVEGQSVLAGSRELYTVPDRVRTTLTARDGSPKRYSDGTEITIFAYKWQSVPGWYLMFAEATSTAFFSIFRNSSYANKDTAMSMIRYTSTAMSPDRRKRFLTYACNRLALKMEEYNASVTGRADSSRISSLFPFAVLDLVTHFGMSDDDFQSDYRRNYADRDPRAFTEYFTRRAAIRSLVQGDLASNPIHFQQALQRIITYCKTPANIL